MSRRAPLVWILLGMLLLGALATWRRVHQQAAWAEGQPVPISAAEPWMLEALPGIGPKTAAAMCASLRAGDLAALPEAAQPLARQLFSGWPADARPPASDAPGGP
jgi:hypothetical protein